MRLVAKKGDADLKFRGGHDCGWECGERGVKREVMTSQTPIF